MKQNAARVIGQLRAIQQRNNKMHSAMNNAPCTLPTMRTASGMSARYLRGMATNNSTNHDVPSRRLAMRK